MDKEILRSVIIDQHNMHRSKSVIERSYQANISELMSSQLIVVITGIKRCGKSTLLNQIREQSQHQDYYINFDDDRLIHFDLASFQILYELLIEMYGVQTTFYFDEIQNIPDWERFVRRLHDQNHKIYITGSNASLLSSELGTRLTGRHIEINLYPFSFSEFLIIQNLSHLNKHDLTTVEKGLLKGALNDYTNAGGMPEYIINKNPEYLQSLYQSILYRDIIVRHSLNNPNALRELIYYLASQIGKLISFNSLKSIVGIKSTSTISEYSQFLEDSYLCFFVNRFDYSLKKQIHSPRKVYLIDTALAVAVGFRMSNDYGRILENIVFLELLRRKHTIYYHHGDNECDFIIRKKNKITTAIQVCFDFQNPTTEKREIAGLVDAMNSYSLTTGIIITNDTETTKQIIHNNIQYTVSVIPIWKWLLDITH